MKEIESNQFVRYNKSIKIKIKYDSINILKFDDEDSNWLKEIQNYLLCTHSFYIFNLIVH
ncbi:hypothetical protein BLOT_000997 [Blomia tropicalis]|nr:hypothetical protein BLOT_000997 [Blomia tropicalis]